MLKAGYKETRLHYSVMLKKFLSGAIETVGGSSKTTTPRSHSSKLQRIASEPYSIQAQRMQDIHRTWSDSTGTTYRSYVSVGNPDNNPDGITCNGLLTRRRSSLKKLDLAESCGERDSSCNLNESSSSKKSVTWIDHKIPGRSISEFHLITPRSFASDRGQRDNNGGHINNPYYQARGNANISLHANQQLQYYYYHQQASRSPRSSCSSCMSTLRTFWWGL